MTKPSALRATSPGPKGSSRHRAGSSRTSSSASCSKALPRAAGSTDRLVRTANFREATFADDACFGDITFAGNTDFRASCFKGDANFGSSTFSGDGDFGGATFARARFEKGANFGGTEFLGNAPYSAHSAANFRGARFHGV